MRLNLVLYYLLMKQTSHIQKIQFWPPIEEELGFSQIVKVGNTIYLSGMVGHKDGGFPGDPHIQYEAVYRNIQEILATQGATLADIAVERVYFTAELLKLDPVVRRRIRGDVYGNSFPASTWVQVQALVEPNAMVEIEVMAVLPE